MLVQVPAALLSILLLAIVLGKAAKGDPSIWSLMPVSEATDFVPGWWLQHGPVPVLAAIWGVNQKVENFYLAPTLSPSLP